MIMLSVTMTEQMHKRARKYQQIRQDTEGVGGMTRQQVIGHHDGNGDRDNTPDSFAAGGVAMTALLQA